MDGQIEHCLMPLPAAGSRLQWHNNVLVCGRRSIEQSSLDGTDRQVVVRGLRGPESLAVFGHHVYWVDRARSLAFTHCKLTSLHTVLIRTAHI